MNAGICIQNRMKIREESGFRIGHALENQFPVLPLSRAEDVESNHTHSSYLSHSVGNIIFLDYMAFC